jgi:hypothetical protein
VHAPRQAHGPRSRAAASKPRIPPRRLSLRSSRPSIRTELSARCFCHRGPTCRPRSRRAAPMAPIAHAPPRCRRRRNARMCVSQSDFVTYCPACARMGPLAMTCRCGAWQAAGGEAKRPRRRSRDYEPAAGARHAAARAGDAGQSHRHALRGLAWDCILWAGRTVDGLKGAVGRKEQEREVGERPMESELQIYCKLCFGN